MTCFKFIYESIKLILVTDDIINMWNYEVFLCSLCILEKYENVENVLWGKD